MPFLSYVELICKFVIFLKGSGIIYCRTRNACEEVASRLFRKGLSAKAYHAGMETRYKFAIINKFYTNVQ